MLNPARSLSSKFKAAAKAIAQSKMAFDDLNDSTRSELRELWLNNEKIAMESRGEELKIYDVQWEKSIISVSPINFNLELKYFV
jgi:hypothetical protein